MAEKFLFYATKQTIQVGTGLIKPLKTKSLLLSLSLYKVRLLTSSTIFNLEKYVGVKARHFWLYFLKILYPLNAWYLAAGVHSKKLQVQEIS